MIHFASNSFSQMRFTPSHELRLDTLHDFGRFVNGQLASAIAKDQCIAITDFELSVERDLESWVAASTNNDGAPDVIVSCVQQYFAGAKDYYGANAEGNSIMILTIMDLWVALDTLAIRQCPLLKQYSPEIPSDFLHPLLLHRSSTLKCALRIEEYLCRRHKEAREVTSIFSNGGDDSFAVKYFRTSKELQRLNDEIIADAKQKRAEKRAELVVLNEEHGSLSSKASKMDHDHESFDILGRDIHSATCPKCQLENRAKALKIHVHEWPLPYANSSTIS
jgi:hypothetical protein